MLILPQTMVSNSLYVSSEQENVMQLFIAEGGPFMYLLLLIGLIAITLFVLRSVQALRSGTMQTPSKSQVNTILHLGTLALLFGVIGQATGLYKATEVIINAANISPEIVARGLHVSFNTTLLGLYELAFAFILWLLLRALAQRTANADETRI